MEGGTKLSVVELASGKTYLGVLNEKGVFSAFDLGGLTTVSRVTFKTYLKQENIGNLDPVKFTAVTDFTSRPLNDEEEAELAFVHGMFKMAQKKAVALNENNTFDELFGKKL